MGAKIDVFPPIRELNESFPKVEFARHPTIEFTGDSPKFGLFILPQTVRVENDQTAIRTLRGSERIGFFEQAQKIIEILEPGLRGGRDHKMPDPFALSDSVALDSLNNRFHPVIPPRGRTIR
ncbi:unnamed protein product, partial [marine sediment metagenome]